MYITPTWHPVVPVGGQKVLIVQYTYRCSSTMYANLPVPALQNVSTAHFAYMPQESAYISNGLQCWVTPYAPSNPVESKVPARRVIMIYFPSSSLPASFFPQKKNRRGLPLHLRRGFCRTVSAVTLVPQAALTTQLENSGRIAQTVPSRVALSKLLGNT